jgi:hypothetical protein
MKMMFLLLLLLPTLSLAGPITLDHWPTRNESCQYDGVATGMDAQVQVYTRFYRSGDLMVARAIIFVNGRKLGVKKTFILEEEASFSASTGAMVELKRNQRDVGCVFGGGECVQNVWDDVRFNWNTPTKLTSWRIDGTQQSTFEKRFPKFAKYWPITMAGKPWFADFFASAPDGRGDMTVTGFNSTLSSPLVFAFFLSRYIATDSARNSNFQILSHVPVGDKRVSVSQSIVSYVPAQRSTVLKASVSLGDFSSPKGRPSSIEVDNESHLLRGMDLILQNQYLGVVEIKIIPKGCGDFSLRSARRRSR